MRMLSGTVPALGPRTDCEGGSALTSADAPREDPGACGHRGLDQPLSKDLLQLGLHLEVLEASVHGNEELGEFQLPVFHHEVEQRVRLGVVGHADVLQRVGGARRSSWPGLS